MQPFKHLQNNNFMKKIISFLFLILFAITSCDTEYNGDVRLQFKGKVVNEFNEPLPNQSVKIFSKYDNSETNSHMIGIGRTDSNGNYSILTPEAIFFDYYTVEINEDVQLTSELTCTKFIKVNNSFYFNNKIPLPTAKLYLKANLSNLFLNFNTSNSQKYLENVEFIGEIAREVVTIGYETPTPEYLKKVKKNQTIEIKYSVFDFSTQTRTTYSNFVSIDNSDDISHTINY